MYSNLESNLDFQSFLTEDELQLQRYNCELWLQELNNNLPNGCFGYNYNYYTGFPTVLESIPTLDSSLISEAQGDKHTSNDHYTSFSSITNSPVPVVSSDFSISSPDHSTSFGPFQNTPETTTNLNSDSLSHEQIPQDNTKSNTIQAKFKIPRPDSCISDVHSALHPEASPNWLLPGMRQRGRNWNPQESDKLEEIMGRYHIDLKMGYSCLRKPVSFWRKISVTMTMEGFPRSDSRCRNRWKVLVEKYLNHKRQSGKST